jgi:hypothetical protein
MPIHESPEPRADLDAAGTRRGPSRAKLRGFESATE